ncbi:MAG TPA: hypothetical protein VLE49_22585 [Anaerolineales bacterium]|nr:hypothetical protein [Anaerolineales bacterium]
MPSDHIIFAGVELSSGRKPVIFAALDSDLNVLPLQNWAIDEAFSCLKEYGNIWLCINLHSLQHEQELYAAFKKKISQAGFKPRSKKGNPKQWLETNAQDCFRALISQNPLHRRTLEGRLQRSAILYEQGLQIRDPVEIFEEITRYKLVQGILPLEDIYSSKELDALVAAYVAWMASTSPGQILVTGEFVLPAPE